MKLIMIYGPPAAGKLTVSKELANRIEFEIFHNHVTYDLFRQVTKVKGADFWRRVNGLRFELIELAAKNDINLIFTICFEPEDIDFIEQLKAVVRENSSEIYFVHLTPKQDVLYERVTQESRKQFRKLSSRDELKKALEEKEYYKTIDDKNSLIIDNTDLTPISVAELIINKFDLK